MKAKFFCGLVSLLGLVVAGNNCARSETRETTVDSLSVAVTVTDGHAATSTESDSYNCLTDPTRGQECLIGGTYFPVYGTWQCAASQEGLICIIDEAEFHRPRAGAECRYSGVEICDGLDNNCDGQVDEGLLNTCGLCGPEPVETCNGRDDNCNGQIDEGVADCTVLDYGFLNWNLLDLR